MSEPGRQVTVGITTMEVAGPDWRVELRRAAELELDETRETWFVTGSASDYRHPGSFPRRVEASLDNAVFLARSEMAPLLERLAAARREVSEAEQALSDWCRGS